MFKDAKVCDKVWSVTNGYGLIYAIAPSSRYPIKVKSLDGISRSYTFDGKERDTDINPTLFWNEFTIPKTSYQKPLPKLEVDTKVLVWDSIDGTWWSKRHFSHFGDDGLIYCFANGFTSRTGKTTVPWQNWELVDE